MMNTKKKVRAEFVDERLADLQNRLSAMLEQTKEAYDIPIKKQAKNMGVSDTNLTKYTQSRADFENQEKKPPKMGVDKLIRICEYFDVSADYMLGLTSDPKLMRRHSPNEDAIKLMCDYTGLNRQVIEVLHRKKDDFLFSAGLIYLLSSKKQLLTNIIEYILTSLHDVVAEDERYSLLPGISSSSEAGKHFFYDVIEELPQARAHFYQHVTEKEVIRERYAREMAIKHVDHEKVFHELFPYIDYHEDWSPNKCAEENGELEKQIFPEISQIADNHSFPINDDDPEVVYSRQLEAFWKDYYARLSG